MAEGGRGPGQDLNPTGCPPRHPFPTQHLREDPHTHFPDEDTGLSGGPGRQPLSAESRLCMEYLGGAKRTSGPGKEPLAQIMSGGRAEDGPTPTPTPTAFSHLPRCWQRVLGIHLEL